VYQLPRPDQRHHRPGRRGVVHAADPAHRVRRRQLCPRPDRNSSSRARARAAAPRPAWPSLPLGLPVESRTASVSDRARPSVRPRRPGARPIRVAYPPANHRNPPITPLEIAPATRAARDGVRTGTHRHDNRPTNADRFPPRGRMSPGKGVRRRAPRRHRQQPARRNGRPVRALSTASRPRITSTGTASRATGFYLPPRACCPDLATRSPKGAGYADQREPAVLQDVEPSILERFSSDSYVPRGTDQRYAALLEHKECMPPSPC
jgi:hypothetical protein